MGLDDYDYEKITLGEFKLKGGFEKWKYQQFSLYYLTPTKDKEGKVVMHFANIDDNDKVAEDKSFRLTSSSQMIRFLKELCSALGFFVGVEGKKGPEFWKNVTKGMKKDFRGGIKKGGRYR